MTTNPTGRPNIGLFVGLGLAALVVVIAASSWIGAANTGAEQERGLQASLDNNKQILAQYSNTIGEIAQIPAMQRDNLVVVLEAAFNGRYGADGSQATFAAIAEAYPGTLDNSLYSRIQDEIVAGRRDFTRNQTQLLDKKRVYEIKLEQPISGFWLRLAGYPRIDLTKIIAVTNRYSDGAFATGQENGLTIGNPQPPVARQPNPGPDAANNRPVEPEVAESGRRGG